jgi:hypothetical protein
MRNIKWLTTNIKGYSRFMAVDEATNEPRSDLNLNNSINFERSIIAYCSGGEATSLPAVCQWDVHWREHGYTAHV